MGSDAITDLLVSWRNGDPDAVHRLVPLVYDELRSLARRQLGGRAGETLRTTALVHEAYLKVARRSRLQVEDRRHFFAIAAGAMDHRVLS